ncbi:MULTISPECIES: wax ester/triacylglycerol synthase family O-acyltransferase [unclassified Mycolicibacterium]|uniref:WS/DGAT/MGAT family O-acyltransferase n=1 Tax=unclassified Mycolicibacterium TaxID=2636767 RepID=UPI0012DC447E|nr:MULTISPECIES: wax ester/triacylglycerol synthase family O-acyltransferase [unclassified Mycolicibacterium]MUL85016.1 wax ester/triacylglycerol synthase family O-acyltransferase [Mycolicibacterium sp. CBMA 329]MUL90983.1 wax ester/triacylglycerol synthase family O-acyltransferase [Mycolicibacterium sp. CBMA 331]MUL98346.1 wax ester/triacylglycerol synthase family O-acyltransferase [Mycolicibacterium sp. CBMA 334]MUM40742.1 wax ester/triacylglycerol synthase family O-acyltransferase [Mycolicib
MEQLTALDAGFLEAEDSDRHASLAIGAIAVLDGPMPRPDTIVAALAERALAVPRLHQLLHTQPLDLGAPQWVEDTNFDASHHIRYAALPWPGDDAALYRWAADVMERRLDRDRPLWECRIVDGLEHNRWAILIKVHHCIADGIAATRLLSRLCDDGDAIPNVVARQATRGTGVFSPVDWIGEAWRISSGLPGAAMQVVRGAVDIVGGLLRPAAATSLTGPVTSMRRYATGEVSMDDVDTVCREFGVTVNDVALAAITDSFRNTLIRRGENPRRDSLRTLVPVSVRSEDARDRTDNRVSVMLPYLPVDKADPVHQLRTVHSRLDRAKASGQREAGNILVSAAKAIPFPLTAWTVRALTRLPQRGVVTVATNVPGPRSRLRVMGCEIVRLLPIPPLAMQLRTGIAIMNYTDRLVFGVIGDYDATPDVDELAKGIERAVARLVDIGVGHWRSTPAGTLQLVQGG